MKKSIKKLCIALMVLSVLFATIPITTYAVDDKTDVTNSIAAVYKMDGITDKQVFTYESNEPVISTDWQVDIDDDVKAATGKYGEALSFSTREQYVRLQHNGSLIENQNDGASFSIWAQNWSIDWVGLLMFRDYATLSAAEITFGNLYRYPIDTTTYEGVFAQRSTAFPGIAGAYRHNGGQWDSFLASSTANLDTFGQNKFSLFTITISHSEGIKFYRDGSLKIHYPTAITMGNITTYKVADAVSIILSNMASNAPEVFIHNGIFGQSGMGQLDELTIHKKALTQADIDLIQDEMIPKTTIMFDTEGGNSIDLLVGMSGKEMVLPVPIKEGFVFAGWYIKDTDTQFKAYLFPENSLSLYAKWQPEQKTYTITYVLDEGINDGRNPKKYQENQKIELIEPYKIGYQFDGWYLDATYQIQYQTEQIYNQDILLYAKFTPLVVTYTINYELDGGVNDKDNPISFKSGEKIELKEATKEGFIFAGWYTDLTYTNKVKTIQSNNQMVYAKWIASKTDTLDTPNIVLISINILLGITVLTVGIFKKRGAK